MMICGLCPFFYEIWMASLHELAANLELQAHLPLPLMSSALISITGPLRELKWGAVSWSDIFMLSFRSHSSMDVKNNMNQDGSF